MSVSVALSVSTATLDGGVLIRLDVALPMLEARMRSAAL